MRSFQHCLLNGGQCFFGIATVGTRNKKRMLIYKMRDIISFAHGDRNRDATKSQGFYQVGTNTRTTHTRDQDVADVTPRPYEVYRLPDLQRVC